MTFTNRAVGLLEKADIQVGGSRPWDIRVLDPRLWRRVLLSGSLGLGDAYVDGWWDAEALDEFFFRVLRAGLDRQVSGGASRFLAYLRSAIVNPQAVRWAFDVGRRHYDIGNDLYRAMLDRRMIYTCARWDGAETLDAAQEAKLDLVCRKLGLQPGQRVLDIGCGWGGFARFAAVEYGAQVVGITVSEEQIALGRSYCEGLPVELHLMDYRSVQGSFDHVVSLGMVEHVGARNYRTYMEVAHRCLAEDGLFLLHTIGGNRSGRTTDPWIDRHIFPRSQLPSVSQLARAAEDLFVLEDVHNFGADYDGTLMAWHSNFESAWPSLKSAYSPRFRRMWAYYLLSCAGSFRARRNQLFQFVFSRNGVRGGYNRPSPAR